MADFSIGDIARKAGIATSTIRYYERIGLLPPPLRENGRRRYDAAILRKLGVIRLAQQAGLSIAEIRSLLHEFPASTLPSERWTALAAEKIPELEAQIQRIQAMKRLLEHTLSCECPTLEDCGGEALRAVDAALVTAD